MELCVATSQVGTDRKSASILPAELRVFVLLFTHFDWMRLQ